MHGARNVSLEGKKLACAQRCLQLLSVIEQTGNRASIWIASSEVGHILEAIEIEYGTSWGGSSQCLSIAQHLHF
jgi:hypothetical protein